MEYFKTKNLISEKNLFTNPDIAEYVYVELKNHIIPPNTHHVCGCNPPQQYSCTTSIIDGVQCNISVAVVKSLIRLSLTLNWLENLDHSCKCYNNNIIGYRNMTNFELPYRFDGSAMKISGNIEPFGSESCHFCIINGIITDSKGCIVKSGSVFHPVHCSANRGNKKYDKSKIVDKCVQEFIVNHGNVTETNPITLYNFLDKLTFKICDVDNVNKIMAFSFFKIELDQGVLTDKRLNEIIQFINAYFNINLMVKDDLPKDFLPLHQIMYEVISKNYTDLGFDDIWQAFNEIIPWINKFGGVYNIATL